MPLTITSLRVDVRETEGWFGEDKASLSYLIVNATFKIDRDDTFCWEQAKGDSEEYKSVLTIDDPERYVDWLMRADGWDLNSRYDGYGRAWTHHDQPWHYIEKFDVFWFREWIADCGPTRSILAELEYYSEYGQLPSLYRTVDAQVILNHFRTLGLYWD
jgi:hypothetical protein